MKFLKFIFLFLLFTASASVVGGQSLSDLDGYSWKPKSEAVTVLSTAKRNAGANVEHPENLVPSTGTVFEQLFFEVVETKIAADIPVPNALVDGFAAAVSVSNNDSAYTDVSEDQKQAAFNKAVELLKQ